MQEVHSMAVVTISRHFGAGGHTLGQMLCERFDFRLADASVVDRLARNAKLSPDWLNAMEKEASSPLLSMISTLVSGGIFYKHPGSPAEKDDRQKYIAFLTQIFTAMANEGGYVIVGRGAQFVLKGHPKAIHVLLVADYESRVSFLMGQHKISRSDAEKTIRAREKERTALASRLFEENIDDASLYQIVLNTGTMPYDWVVDTVSELVTRFMGRE
jgi:cytidylate kinase